MGAEEIIAGVIGFLTGFIRIVYWYAEALFRQFVPPSMKSIDGETILVTGATGGIGKEICRNLVKSGSNLKLVLWDVNQADLDKLAGELKASGSSGLKVYPFAVDISTRENIDAGCQQIKDACGPASIIFNNAGIACMGNLLQLSNDQIQKTIDVNLTSHLWIIRQFLPDMVAKNHGRIINTCSMGGLKAATHAVPYFASKFGVNGYTEGLKAELQLQNYKYDGIKLTTVYPYFVQTPLIKSLAVNQDSGTKMPLGLGKFFTPEEVGKKMVDGMRREYEYIYFPSNIPIICFFDFLIPAKARRAVGDKYFNNFMFKDEKEQERLFNTPYHASSASSSAKNGKAKKNK